MGPGMGATQHFIMGATLRNHSFLLTEQPQNESMRRVAL